MMKVIQDPTPIALSINESEITNTPLGSKLMDVFNNSNFKINKDILIVPVNINFNVNDVEIQMFNFFLQQFRQQYTHIFINLNR
jgi:hypothetical protein